MINNELELESAINNVLMHAVDNTMEIALKKLLDIIEQTVYSYSATWVNGYEGDLGRTHEFYDTWDKTKAKVAKAFGGSKVEASILQTLPLTYHAPFSHGSIVEGGAIDKDDLNNIINKGLKESHMNFPAIEARPFWDEFEKWCDNNIIKIFQAECRKVGLNMKVGASYSIT